jgi:hypothetical protein
MYELTLGRVEINSRLNSETIRANLPVAGVGSPAAVNDRKTL